MTKLEMRFEILKNIEGNMTPTEMADELITAWTKDDEDQITQLYYETMEADDND